MAQSVFKVELSRDSVLIGNTFTLTYVLENIQGEFEAPNMSDLNVISGPNMSSSFQFINGESKRSVSYSYVVKPLEEGEIIIDQAFVVSEEHTYESDFITVNVFPNPDGIIENEPEMVKEFRFSFPFDNFEEQPKDEKKTKKYKLKKI
jgi:hypothetical protein